MVKQLEISLEVIKQYDKAKEAGYPGSFEDFINEAVQLYLKEVKGIG